MNVSKISSIPNPAYKADWPFLESNSSSFQKVTSLFFDMLSVLIFPEGGRMARYKFQELATKAIYQDILEYYRDPKNIHHLKSERKKLADIYKCKQKILQSPDGVLIHAMISQGRDKKAILYVPRIGECYENSGKDFLDLIRKDLPDVTVLMINPRGIGDNLGQDIFPTPKGLSLDVCTAYFYLIRKLNIQADHIVLYGYPFDEAYSKIAKETTQEKFSQHALDALNSRSLKHMAIEVKWFLGESIKKHTTAFALKFLNFQTDIEKASTRLRDRKCTLLPKDDGQGFQKKASLYKVIPSHCSQNEKRIVCVQLQKKGRYKEEMDCNTFRHQEKAEVAHQLKHLFDSKK
ncbi:MAG: hypothetical protein ACM3JI_04950 [Anaerolineae bacterium]